MQHDIFTITVGVILTGLGMIGSFLPILPGTLFFLVGIFLIASQWPWLDRELTAWSDRYLGRYPEWHKRFQHARDRASQYLGGDSGIDKK